MARIWPLDQTAQVKQEVKADLDEALIKGSDEDRLTKAWRRFEELDADQTTVGCMRRFIYGVSALVQHAKTGGMTPHQVKQAQKLLRGILATSGIKPGVTKGAQFYAELNMILAQIYRAEGRHFDASWQQDLASFDSRREVPGGEAFQSLQRGNRLLRLGAATAAEKCFRDAMQGTNPERVDEAKLALAKTIRISGRIDEAIKFIAENPPAPTASQLVHDELRWEKLCLGCQKSGDFVSMITACRKDNGFNLASYQFECGLWVRSMESVRWNDLLPKISGLSRRCLNNPKDEGPLFTLCQQLERCYDFDIPLRMRIENLGEELANIGQLKGIDKQLLALSAAYRFLIRSKAFEFAETTRFQYESLSMTLSEGRSRDVLGVLTGSIATDETDEQAPLDHAVGQ